MSSQRIQWYPGHIAKAEKQLHKNLEKVDLVIEVRDARIPLSTTHPHLERWIKGKSHLLVINRRDMITEEAIKYWDKHLKENGLSPLWCNAKVGTGVKQLQQAAIRSGDALNARRKSRGMKNRAVRALTLGFPNVGKSALINRLMRRKVVQSSRKAGVTRSLRWVRIGGELDLLDAPGVLPPSFENQSSAIKLALCDDIGQAAYESESVAIAFIKMLLRLENYPLTGVGIGLLENRYGVPISTNEADCYRWLTLSAMKHTSGDTKRMAKRLLEDFRKGLLGLISLELPLGTKND